MLTTHLLSKINDYLVGESTLAQLEAWLAPYLPSLYASGPASALKLVDTIELGLAEIDENLLTESELKQRLINIMATEPIYMQYPEERGNYSGSSNATEYVISVSSIPTASSQWRVAHTLS